MAPTVSVHSPPRPKRRLTREDSDAKADVLTIRKKRRPIADNDITPEKCSRPSQLSAHACDGATKVSDDTKLEDTAIAKQDTVMAAEDTPDECAVLPQLFFGLDVVLRLLAARGVKPFLPVIKKDVEAVTGRDLNDFRLTGVLALSESMFGTRWVGSGREAKFEIFQRAKDGVERAPTMEEQRARKESFNAALALATSAGKIPRCVFSPRPPALSSSLSAQKATAPAVPALPELAAAERPASSAGLSAIKRRQALLERIRAKESQGDSVEAKEYDELRKKLVVCDNAMTTHSLLQSLFARGEGKHSAATDAEIIQALCSATYGMQSMRKLEKPSALEAIELLASKSSGWFLVEAGKHTDMKYFRRVPKGSSTVALEAVQAERQDIENQLRALCELAKRRQDEIRSHRVPAADAVAETAVVVVAVKKEIPVAPVAKKRELKPSLSAASTEAPSDDDFDVVMSQVSVAEVMVLDDDDEEEVVVLDDAEAVKVAAVDLPCVGRRLRRKTCVA